jgi:hypothetical protein
MRLFTCQHCNNAIHFDNTICVNCQSRLGYLSNLFDMSALEPSGEAWRASAASKKLYRLCANAKFDACNWLLPADANASLCTACRHNRKIPDLSNASNIARWQKIELAKRYLFYSLTKWNLPTPDRIDDPKEGLAFDFLADEPQPDGSIKRVLTGHEDGAITINIAEAEDAEREMRRNSMGEPYRTLLGHFRHEIGHYYWDRLVRDSDKLDRFRTLFGDERQDYGEALKRHYENGAPANWQESFISAYAASHPWEDFAETWAHNIHMVDSLETSHTFELRARVPRESESSPLEINFDTYAERNVRLLVECWAPLTIVVNSINRSMGQADLYPFVLSTPVTAKLQFVNDAIHGRNSRSEPGGRKCA